VTDQAAIEYVVGLLPIDAVRELAVRLLLERDRDMEADVPVKRKVGRPRKIPIVVREAIP